MLIPVIVAIFLKTKKHYDSVASQLTLRDWTPPAPSHQHRARADRRRAAGVVECAAYAESISTDVRAVYVNDNTEQTGDAEEGLERPGEAAFG